MQVTSSHNSTSSKKMCREGSRRESKGIFWVWESSGTWESTLIWLDPTGCGEIWGCGGGAISVVYGSFSPVYGFPNGNRSHNITLRLPFFLPFPYPPVKKVLAFCRKIWPHNKKSPFPVILGGSFHVAFCLSVSPICLPPRLAARRIFPAGVVAGRFLRNNQQQEENGKRGREKKKGKWKLANQRAAFVFS